LSLPCLRLLVLLRLEFVQELPTCFEVNEDEIQTFECIPWFFHVFFRISSGKLREFMIEDHKEVFSLSLVDLKQLKNLKNIQKVLKCLENKKQLHSLQRSKIQISRSISPPSTDLNLYENKKFHHRLFSEFSLNFHKQFHHFTMAKVSLYDHSRDRTIELENSSTVTVGRGFFEVKFFERGIYVSSTNFIFL
jgi:hypothetical protein